MTDTGSATTGTPDDAPLEASLQRLEEIAKALERGDLPLEDGLRLFEEGVALARRLEARLADAEMKVETLLRGASGDERVVPYQGAPGAAKRADDEDAG